MARRRPRLFAFPREVELRDLRQWASDPEEVRLWTHVVDSFDEIANTKEISPALLAPFIHASQHPRPTLRGLAMTRLSVLCHYFPEAIEAYAWLTQHPDTDLRKCSVLAMSNAPKPMLLQLLPAALTDREWHVRKAAAQVAGALPLPSLLAFLEARQHVEADARVRVVLQMAVRHQQQIDATEDGSSG